MGAPKLTKAGVWVINVHHQGSRCKLTLGKLSRPYAESFAHNLDLLKEHVKFGGSSLPPRLQAWVGDLNERHKKQLSRVGLFEYRTNAITVGELMDRYVTAYERTNNTSGSKIKVRSTVKNRLGKLREVLLSEIEPVQRNARQTAEPVWTDGAIATLTDFNMWQRNHFAQATWTRDNRMFSSVGIWAVKQGYCDYNPFSNLPTASMVNDDRNAYIPKSLAIDAMEACLSPDIRLTIAMGRFAGMRTCSEVRTMKWDHLDFDEMSLTIIDSKKRLPRKMPLFDDIAQEIERMRPLTGSTRFIASERMRASTSANNFQKVRQAVQRSGQNPWPRIRQNLRASCENDFLAQYREQEVTQWIGHTVSTSRKHYQKQRPEDYRKAIAAAEGL